MLNPDLNKRIRDISTELVRKLENGDLSPLLIMLIGAASLPKGHSMTITHKNAMVAELSFSKRTLTDEFQDIKQLNLFELFEELGEV